MQTEQFKVWLNEQEVMLRAGEMEKNEKYLVALVAANVYEVVQLATTNQELRTLGAILGGMSRDLLKLSNSEEEK